MKGDWVYCQCLEECECPEWPRRLATIWIGVGPSADCIYSASAFCEQCSNHEGLTEGWATGLRLYRRKYEANKGAINRAHEALCTSNG